MKSITDSVIETIAMETSKSEKGVKNLEQLLDEIKKTGLIKQPNYTLPLADTIGKNYYSSINKRIP